MEEKKLNSTIDSVNTSELNNCILKMENEIKNIEALFTKIENDMKSFHGNEIWYGDANEAYFNRFLMLKNFFPKVNMSLYNFVNYLKVTNENYINAENSINKDVDTNEIELNVN